MCVMCLDSQWNNSSLVAILIRPFYSVYFSLWFKCVVVVCAQWSTDAKKIVNEALMWWDFWEWLKNSPIFHRHNRNKKHAIEIWNVYVFVCVCVCVLSLLPCFEGSFVKKIKKSPIFDFNYFVWHINLKICNFLHNFFGNSRKV